MYLNLCEVICLARIPIVAKAMDLLRVTDRQRHPAR
jgi:hypothetical protein